MTLDEMVSACNPGIRKTVRWLNENGFHTIDSGDGKTHEFECDREGPYVIIDCGQEFHKLLSEADRLYAMVHPLYTEDAYTYVQASYSPDDKFALIELVGFADNMLRL